MRKSNKCSNELHKLGLLKTVIEKINITYMVSADNNAYQSSLQFQQEVLLFDSQKH